METIKNYLESMFRNLPKTEKVLRAKSELLQMMEDKYTELVENGISENEAVGTVISEFGNLDELADDLGISEELVVHKTANEKSRKVTFDEVQSFLNWRKQVPIYRGLGIGLCICCVVFPILFEFLPFGDILGPVFMFISIAVGVCLIVFAGKGGQDWHFLLQEPCSIDDKTYNYVSDKKREFYKTGSIITSLAIACYILCFVLAVTIESTADSEGEIKVHFNKEKLKPSIYVKDSKLYIEQNIPGNLHGNNNCYVKIFVPETMELKESYMKVNVGAITVKDISSESFTIKTNVGAIDLNKAIFQTFEGTSNVGEIKISNLDNLDYYNMNLESNVGVISVDSKKFKRGYNQKGSSDKLISAKTNVGEVVIF